MLRQIRREWTFGLAVSLILGVAIGATASVFAVVDALLLRPLPYPHADRLVQLETEDGPRGVRSPGVGADSLRALSAAESAFVVVEPYRVAPGILTEPGQPSVLETAEVSPNLLATLGAVPQIGRLFTDQDAATGAAPVALISETLWNGRFGRDPDVIGRTLVIDDERRVRIVGVLPRMWAFPAVGTGIWRPLAAAVRSAEETGSHAIGRLQPGVSMALAQESVLDPLSEELVRAGSLPPEHRLVIDLPRQQRYGLGYRGSLYPLLGAVSLLLLIACLNVTSLMFVRASFRRQTLAIATALGASRARLLRHALVEALVPGLVAALVAIAFTVAGVAAIRTLVPQQVTLLLASPIAVDVRVVGLAIVLAATTCAVAGLVPAVHFTRRDPIAMLTGRHLSPDRAVTRFNDVLVSAQLALLVVVLAAAGLLLQSLIRTLSIDPGFDTEHLTRVWIELPQRWYPTPAAKTLLLGDAERALEDLSQVRAVTIASNMAVRAARPETDGQGTAEEGARFRLPYTLAQPDYFDTLRLPLIAGRGFRVDDLPDVVIVNDRLARRYWPGRSPLGRRFRASPDRPWRTVIGVARDVRVRGPNEALADGMEFYLPLTRRSAVGGYQMFVRTSGPAPALEPEIRRVVARLDRRLPVLAVESLDGGLGSIERPRFLAALFASFGGLGGLLAGVGLYATTAFWIRTRTHELAIRLALGGTTGSNRALVFRRSATLAVVGLAFGLVAALSTTTSLRAGLFETSPYDPLTFAIVVAVVAGLTLVACVVPVGRTRGIDPVAVLRRE